MGRPRGIRDAATILRNSVGRYNLRGCMAWVKTHFVEFVDQEPFFSTFELYEFTVEENIWLSDFEKCSHHVSHWAFNAKKGVNMVGADPHTDGHPVPGWGAGGPREPGKRDGGARWSRVGPGKRSPAFGVRDKPLGDPLGATTEIVILCLAFFCTLPLPI